MSGVGGTPHRSAARNGPPRGTPASAYRLSIATLTLYAPPDLRFGAARFAPILGWFVFGRFFGGEAMKIHLLRAVLSFAVLFLVSTAGAQAGTVTCPSLVPPPGVTLTEPPGVGKATENTGSELICSFPVFYTAIAQEVSQGVCTTATKSLNFGTSGGTGTWHLGPPGTANPVILSAHYFQAPSMLRPGGGVILGIHYCYYGYPTTQFRITPTFTLTASTPVPAGDTCTISGPNTFSCTAPPPITCPSTIPSSKIPTASFPNAPWSSANLPTSGTAWSYTRWSGIYQEAGTSANGALFEPQNVPLSTIQSAMAQQSNPPFAGTTWSTPNTNGVVWPVPPGYVGCQYAGPQFPFVFSGSNYILAGVVAIVCKGSSCNL